MQQDKQRLHTLNEEQKKQRYRRPKDRVVIWPFMYAFVLYMHLADTGFYNSSRLEQYKVYVVYEK